MCRSAVVFIFHTSLISVRHAAYNYRLLGCFVCRAHNDQFYVYAAAGVPTNLMANEVDPSTVRLTWKEPQHSDVDTYTVKWSSAQV